METPHGHITNLSTLNFAEPATEDQAEPSQASPDLETLRHEFKQNQRASAEHFPLLSPRSL